MRAHDYGSQTDCCSVLVCDCVIYGFLDHEHRHAVVVDRWVPQTSPHPLWHEHLEVGVLVPRVSASCPIRASGAREHGKVGDYVLSKVSGHERFGNST